MSESASMKFGEKTILLAMHGSKANGEIILHGVVPFGKIV